MGRITTPALLALALLACGCAAPAASAPGPAPAPAPPTATLADLSFMSGHWLRDDDGVRNEERWSTPQAGTMVGANQTARADRTVAHESLLLVEDDGGVVYRAWPPGQPATSFRLVHHEPTRATFENPAHDFPQRIIYWRTDDVLHARIEGSQDGKPSSAEWRWQLQKPSPPSAAPPPARKKATGIGGVFFKSKDPKALRAWYAKHLGLVTNEYGSLFEFRSTDDPSVKGYLQWSPFSQTTKYFAPSEKEFMINYRVEDVAALVAELRQAGVTIVDAIEEHEYGKFVHIMDPEGNKLELWEPVDTVFTRMYEGKTTH